MSTYDDGSLIQHAIILHNTRRVTSNKVQQSEREKKLNWKLPQGTFIIINEVWHHILNYSEVITHLNIFKIQTTSLETRNRKSLQNPDNPTNKNLFNMMLMSLIIPKTIYKPE